MSLCRVLLLATGLAACTAQRPAAPLAAPPVAEPAAVPSAALEPAIRLVASGDVRVRTNWYEDEYGHSTGDKLDAALSYEGATTLLVVRSHDMSGVTLELRFFRNANDPAADPDVLAFGTWRKDYGKGPRMGNLTDLRGEVLINTSYVDRADPLMCRFFVTGKHDGRIVCLAGAVSVDAPKVH